VPGQQTESLENDLVLHVYRHHALIALLEIQNEHTDTPESAPMAS